MPGTNSRAPSWPTASSRCSRGDSQSWSWRQPPGGAPSRRSGRRSDLPSRSPTSAATGCCRASSSGRSWSASSRNPWPLALIVARVQVVQPIVDVRILRALKFDPRLERVRDPIILSLVAGPAGAFLAAVLPRSASTSLAGRIPQSNGCCYDFVLWWLRDWLGVMVTAAADLRVGLRPRRSSGRGARVAEGVGLMLTLFVGIAADVRAVGRVRDAQRADRVHLLSDRRLGRACGSARAASTTLVALMSAFAIAIAGLRLGPFADVPGGVHAVPVVHRSSRWARSAACCSPRSWPSATMRMNKRLLLEEQLRHSQKMEAVGRLAGGIAHDFNNLLTAIIGYTEIVLHSLDPKDDRRADAEEIGRAAMRAADLTRQMLAFSRRQVLQPKVIDLNIALSKVEPMLRRVIGEDIVMTVTGKAAQRVRARRSRPGRTGGDEPGGQRARRDAAGRPPDRRNRRRRCSTKRRWPTCPTRKPGRLRDAVGVGHRRRHAAGGARAHLRAVLHDQGRRQGHRPRPVDRLRHRPPERRPHRRVERAGAWHHVPHLPAAIRSAAARWPPMPASSRCRKAPSTSCSSKTTRRCAGCRRNCWCGSAIR